MWHLKAVPYRYRLMKRVIDSQRLGYASGPLRNLGVKDGWVEMDGEKDRGKGGAG